MIARRLLACAALLLPSLGGCAAQTKYYWGDYESLLFKMYDAPGEAPPERQIERITRDLEIARSKGKPIAPGVYAHRGLMHLKAGNGDAALADLQAEKKLYPESGAMVDRMIAGMSVRPKP